MHIWIYDTATAPQNLTETIFVNANENAAYCKGCFACWLKTPGKCIMSDRLEFLGSKIMQADSVTIVSECFYGGFSPNVKRVLDRCIPGVMPFFVTKRNGEGKREQHHSARYPNRMKLTVCFYGNISESEKELARKLVEANGLNYWAKSTEVLFAESEEEVTA